MITGIITNEGLAKAIIASNNKGWYINLGKFYVSEQKGDLDATRTISDMNPTWYSAEISSIEVLSPQVLQLNLTIPVNATTEPKQIAEIYITAFNPDTGEEFLFSIQQCDPVVEYDPTGSITLKTQIKIQNLDLTDIFQFTFTYGVELEDHNNDPNAHPHIREALKKAGIYIDGSADYSSFTYVGQFWDEKAEFDASVSDGMLVYKGSDGKYYPAIADGSEKSKVVGYADVTNGKVIVSGLIQTSLTYPAGTDLYLSATNAGQFTDQPTTVKVGLSLGNGLILLGTVGGGTGTGDQTSEDTLYEILLTHSSFEYCYYDGFTTNDSVTVSGLTYDASNTAWQGDSGDYFTHQVISGSDTYYKFLVHVEADNTVNPSLQYSIDGGSTWQNGNLDEVITVESGFTTLDIKITWNGSGKVYSFGVLYKETGFNAVTDTQAFEVLNITSDQSAPVTITLPNNMVYTPDGKSLEVYLNRQRLINGIDFTEVDNRTIQLNIDLKAGDTLVFIQKYGYVDTSVENKTRLDYEHNEIGQHIFTDLSTGKKYRLAVDNGNLVLIPV
jgi:hypothetical protein